MTVPESLMTAQEVASMLGVSIYTVHRLKFKPGGLPAYKVGGCVRFKRGEVETYLAARAVKPVETAQKLARGHFKYTPGMKVVSV